MNTTHPDRIAAARPPLDAVLNERKRIAKSLRRRGDSALNLAAKGRLEASEAARLKRWLEAAAEDVEAGLE